MKERERGEKYGKFFIKVCFCSLFFAFLEQRSEMQEKSGERQEQVLFSFSMSDREEGKGEEGGGQLIVGTEMELIGALEENLLKGKKLKSSQLFLKKYENY